jgi:hypothetical protein
VVSTLTEQSEAIAAALNERAEQLRTLFDDRGLGIVAALGRRGDAISNALDQRSEQLRVLFEGKGGDVVEALGRQGEAISGALDERTAALRALFDAKGSGMVEALDERGQALAAAFTAAGETVVRALEHRGNAFVAGLRDRGAAISNAIETSSNALRETLESGSRQSIDALVGTNEQLRDELGGMLGRLGEANKLMQQIVNGANKNLAAVENSLSTRVGELQTVISTVMEEANRASQQVTAQIADLKDYSEGTLRETTALVAKLDDKGASLGEVTQASSAALNAVVGRLEQVEARVGKALAERRDSLEELHALISGRTEDVEAITRSFASLIDESLGTAEARARQIGAVLSDSAEATTSAIAQQFETIRSATGKERERTAEALRAAYAQVTTEIDGELSKVTDRFQKAAQDMRGVTVDIQRELETTRAELKRGVLELPQETQESASAMRRVVAEQIKALNDLTEIVTRSGRRGDVSLPIEQAPPRRAAAPVVSAPAAAQPAPVYTAPAQPKPPAAEGPALRPSLDAAPEPTPSAPPARAESRVEAKPAPRPAPVQEAPRRAPEPQQPAKAGWLSDLLVRASRDDKAPEVSKPTTHSIEKLDSLSVDIARMIDHDAAVELWDRYKRGERNVFTRRLYTLQGQQTFDEIRRKYRRDMEFRETVDRYIDEFERLLGEASKDDRDSMVAKTYLTSETGKVYTMLAHASGRFE